MNAVILERAYHLQAGAVANVRQARILVSAEVSLQNPAIRSAIEKRAPCLQFAHAFRRFPGVQFGHAPVVEVLAAAHGVGEMDPPAIAIVNVGQRRRNSAFGHNGVRFTEQRLADYSHGCAVGSGLDGRAQPCPARANHQHIVGEPLELRHLENSPIMPDTHRTEADVDIGKRDPKEARPRPLLMGRIQAAYAIVEFMTDGVIGDLVEAASDHVPECMTPEDISGQEHDVHDQNKAPDPDSKSVGEEERLDRVVDEKAPDM